MGKILYFDKVEFSNIFRVFLPEKGDKQTMLLRAADFFKADVLWNL